MKMHCECGEMTIDQTDSLPYKAHSISGQDWFRLFDTIDKIISEVASGHMSVDHAQSEVRRTHIIASRHMYQCGQCGRLLVDDKFHRMNIYTPASDTVSRHILRSHD